MAGKGENLIIVGAGVWGLSCALACARRGWRVTVLERGRVADGASGGVVGALAPHVPENWNEKKQFQFEALDSAADYWAEVEAVAGLPTGFGRIGRLQPLASEAARERARARAEAARRHWHGRYTWEVVDALGPFGAIFDSLSGRIAPAAATRALAGAARACGVEILEGVAVEALAADGVQTRESPRAADAVIVAAGVGGFALLAPHVPEVPGRAQKGQAAVLGADLGNRPQIFDRGLYIVPHADGTVAVGSTSEDSFEAPFATDDQLDALIARARATLPELADAPVLRRWAGLRPRARRGEPMLGAIPGLPRHFAALGAYKIGFGLAPRVGAVLADALEGRATLPESFTVAHHMR